MTETMDDIRLREQLDPCPDCGMRRKLPGGVPALSSGVERELQHAFEGSKEVYVVWKPRKSKCCFCTRPLRPSRLASFSTKNRVRLWS